MRNIPFYLSDPALFSSMEPEYTHDENNQLTV